MHMQKCFPRSPAQEGEMQVHQFPLLITSTNSVIHNATITSNKGGHLGWWTKYRDCKLYINFHVSIFFLYVSNVLHQQQ